VKITLTHMLKKQFGTVLMGLILYKVGTNVGIL
jgi:hypothetical protein